MLTCVFLRTKRKREEFGPCPRPWLNSARSGKKTIVIVDDHPVLRLGLITLIESEPDLDVRAAVATCQAALAAIRQSHPDLVIVDLVLGEGDGLELVKQIKTRHPGIPSLVLSMHDELVYAARALSAGARGYVTKQQLDETVLIAIRRVLSGEIYMSEALERRLAGKYLGGRTLETDLPLHTLSDRELQVFRLIGEGRTTRRIAETLARSVKTIESHLEHIKNKLEVGSGAELVRRAAQWVETGRIGRSPDCPGAGDSPPAGARRPRRWFPADLAAQALAADGRAARAVRAMPQKGTSRSAPARQRIVISSLIMRLRQAWRIPPIPKWGAAPMRA